jgi:DNA-binding NtrC family response regulator
MDNTDPSLHILLIDDEADIIKSIGTYLTDLGHHLHSASKVSEGLAMLKNHPIDIVITDIRLPDGDGFDILHNAKKTLPNSEVIMMTAYGDMQSAVRALREGAFDFYNKPIKLRELTASLKRTIRFQTLKRQNETFRTRLDRVDQDNQKNYGLSAIIGQSKAIQSVRNKIEQVSQTPNTTVLITGETGTGKELVARAIHQGSNRANHPFVAVDCSAITETLFETAFYGHIRGAFTDAREPRQGYFELANGGTLFLDEIGDMNLDMQAGLLRTLEERRIRPVGSNQEIPIDIRVVSATNRDLTQAMQHNTFRKDLYYRLNTFMIHLPLLANRTEDIPPLAQHFLEIFSRDMHKQQTTSSSKSPPMACFIPLQVPARKDTKEMVAHQHQQHLIPYGGSPLTNLETSLSAKEALAIGAFENSPATPH